MVFFERNRGAEPGFQFLDNLYAGVSMNDPLEYRYFKKMRPPAGRPAKKPHVNAVGAQGLNSRQQAAAAAHPHLRVTPPCPLVGPEKEALQAQLRQAAISRLVIKVS